MASIFSSTTQKIGDYLTCTSNQCLSPEEQSTLDSSTISWTSDSPTIDAQDLDLDFVHEIFSNTSKITNLTTSIELDPDFPSSVLTRKRKQTDKVEVSIPDEDFGTFEDWLRWDDSEPHSVTAATSMNRSNSTPQPQVDDSVVFIEDPVSNSPLFQPRIVSAQGNINNRIESASSSFDNLNLVGIPPRATVFNSPLQLVAGPTWPQPQQQYVQPTFFSSMLSPQEEARLRSIAMPQLNTGSPFSSTDFRSSHLPAEHGNASKRPALHSQATSRRTASRKRKSTIDEHVKLEATDVEEEHTFNVEEPSPSSSSAAGTAVTAPVLNVTKGKKTSHNMIEKRYRNNLNDKIAELKNSVPSLRAMSKHNSQGGSDDDEEEEEDLDGLTPAHRLNKATILSKATEYINHLERRNEHLTKENAGLKARVDAFEILLMSRQQSIPHPSQQYHYVSQQQGQQEYRGW